MDENGLNENGLLEIEDMSNKLMLELAFSSWLLCTLFIFSIAMLFLHIAIHDLTRFSKNTAVFVSASLLITALVLFGTSIYAYIRRRFLLDEKSIGKGESDFGAFWLLSYTSLGVFASLAFLSFLIIYNLLNATTR